MDLKLKDEFLVKWKKYFGETDLPFVFFYSKTKGDTPLFNSPPGWSCLICELAKVRKGESMAYNETNLKCGGARRYTGYSKEMRTNFEYFLSYGIPGEMEGERYLRTPEMVKKIMQEMKTIIADEQFLLFKRWDKLEEQDEPDAVIFITTPDVLSGLFTLCNFDQEDGMGVMAPFGSGCGTLINRVYFEKDKENPKAVLGMFDVSARPCVPKDTLSLAIPMKKFTRMIGYMDESFLITESWQKVQNRI